jgi:2-polyprenyl-3-methyl-5-hydroxy-6-metoxy-1,4-benzoquinol methylase
MPNCSFCKKPLKFKLVDLGYAPVSNTLLNKRCLKKDKNFKLTVSVCTSCWLAQTLYKISPKKIFTSNYSYFSSYSSTLLSHAKKLVHQCIKNFNLNKNSLIYEVACNDGYLLQYFKKKEIPCIGIEPTSNTANFAKKVKKLKILNEFFDSKLSIKCKKKYGAADLIISANVLAHVPNIKDFIKAHNQLIKDDGIIIFEFHYLANLIEQVQFDQVYHEHYFYLSLFSVQKILHSFKLEIFDCDLLNTQGGSIRIYIKKMRNKKIQKSTKFKKILADEIKLGISSKKFYLNFQKKSEMIKKNFYDFLVMCKKKKLKVIGYGAAAKGITLINFANIKNNLLSYIIDKSPEKQNKFLQLSKIKIVPMKILLKKTFDYIIIFPWNIKAEILKDLRNYKKTHTAKKIVFFPKRKIY